MNFAIFYHTYVSGPGVDFEHGIGIVQEQLHHMEQSGVIRAANEFHIGISGGEANVSAVSMIAPVLANLIEHGPETCAELPTLCKLQEWLPAHRDWYVLYLHTKASLYKGNETWARWRRCMMNVVVGNWKGCVKDLDEGFDAAGPHWLTPQTHPIIGKVPYFGGNFWWARASYLARLPKLSPNGPSRYEAEVWIGKARPSVRAYQSHWPGAACAA